MPPPSTNLKTWFRSALSTYSDTGGTVPCADGDPVKFWGDQSGNANTAKSTSTGTSPIFKSAGVTINGTTYASVRFAAGSSQKLVNATASFLGAYTSHETYSAYIVMSKTTADACMMGNQGSGGLHNSNQQFRSGYPSATQIYMYDAVNAVNSTSMAVAVTTPSLVEVVYDNANMYFYQNTNPYGSPSAVNGGGIWWDCIGAGAGGPSLFLSGDIVEILLYTGNQNSTVRGQVESYVLATYPGLWASSGNVVPLAQRNMTGNLSQLTGGIHG